MALRLDFPLFSGSDQCCWTFEYTNHNLGSGPCVMHLRSNADLHGIGDFVVTRTVAFQNTDWHGSWQIEDQFLVIDFNCHGNEQQLKRTRLHVVNNKDFAGFDYLGRRITLTFLQLLKLDDEGQWVKQSEVSSGTLQFGLA